MHWMRPKGGGGITFYSGEIWGRDCVGRTQIRSSVGEMKEDVGIGKSSCSGGGEREKRWGGGM